MMQTKTAAMVAAELRRVADALDHDPMAVIPTAMLTFYGNDYGAEDKGKAAFLNIARLLPRPISKERFTECDFAVGAGSDGALWYRATISRSAICTIVEPARPAVYHCEPILSDAEEEAIA